MSRTKTLAQLRSLVENQSDIVGATTRYSATLLNGLINQSIQRFRERVSIEGSTRYLTQWSDTLTTGAASGLPFAIIELAQIVPGVVRTFGVDLTINGQILSLEHRPFEERAKFGNRPAVPVAWAPYGDKVAIMPPPVGSYPFTVWYLPLLADLTSDSDTWDGVAGWEDFVVWDVFQRLATRDSYEKVFAQASVVKDQIIADIVRGATKVSHAGGAHRGRDTMGALGVFGLPTGRRTTSAGGGLPPDSSITNTMLAQMVARTIKGNFAYSPANPQDLSGAQVADILPSFAGGAGGLVPTGAGNSALFLTNAGTWVAPSIGGSVSGVALEQLQNIPGPRVLGNMGPTGAITPLLGQQVASMIGVFTGSAHGLVPYPSGGIQGHVLSDAGTWVAQSGGVSSGIANNQLLVMPPLSFKGNFGSTSGGPSDLTKQQAASLMPNFFQASGAGRGFVVAPTGGAAGNVLQDDGIWVPQTGGGGGPTMLAAGPEGAVQFNAGSGFGGATGFRFSAASGLHLMHQVTIPSGWIGFGPAPGARGGTPATAGELLLSNDTTLVRAALATGPASSAQLIKFDNFNRFLLGDALVSGENHQVRATGAAYVWLHGGTETVRHDASHLRLNDGMRLGVTPLAIPDTVGDKLGGWTSSGFANLATGINITASGTRLSFGSGGPQIHASGIDLRSGDIRNVRRLNGLDGIKLYGDLPDANSSIVAPSGTVFIVPLTSTQGRVYSAEPSGAEHGDIVLIENRSAFSHSIYNTGTGMGAPSGWVATLAPSGGLSLRFASGAWEFGAKYKLGGF